MKKIFKCNYKSKTPLQAVGYAITSIANNCSVVFGVACVSPPQAAWYTCQQLKRLSQIFFNLLSKTFHLLHTKVLNILRIYYRTMAILQKTRYEMKVRMFYFFSNY